LGAAVLSTDAVVHELYLSDEVRDAVVARFGPSVAPDGVVDRAVLAEHAFATPEDRAWLEQLIWPLVGERIRTWQEHERAEMRPPKALVVEIPLLFESGMDHGCNATITVVADEQLRDERARARGHRVLDARAARQLPQAEKAALSTFVVTNDEDLPALERKLSAVLDMLER
jgi:dephospho-CoA kinase